jgi:hypothetical protein
LPDHPQPDDATVVPAGEASDHATVVPAGQAQRASSHRLRVAPRRPRVYRPRPWRTFTFAAVLAAAVVIVALAAWSRR